MTGRLLLEFWDDGRGVVLFGVDDWASAGTEAFSVGPFDVGQQFTIRKAIDANSIQRYRFSEYAGTLGGAASTHAFTRAQKVSLLQDRTS
jgi:hypothetical protein